jgi:hypothetical protein
VIRYDVTILDHALDPVRGRFLALTDDMFHHHLHGASVALSKLSAFEAEKRRPGDGKVAVAPEAYAVAHTADNTALHGSAPFTSAAAAAEQLARAVAADPALHGALHVLPAYELAA